MARFQLPYGQVFTLAGRLGSGYKLRFYNSGTSTPRDTYSNAGLSVANANPVIADAEGRFSDIFLSNVAYKVTLSDSDDVLIWTADPVQSDLVTLGDPVSIAHGGTGATTASAARTALGLGTAATYDVGTGASQIPTNSMAAGVPTGGIILWYGATTAVPTGFGLCNGTTYSRSDGSGSITAPDLRDRFIVGAGSSYSVGATGGATSVTSGASGSLSVTVAAGGDHSHGGATDGHTLTIAEMPSHRHDFTVKVDVPAAGFYMVNSAGGAATVTIADDPVQATGGGGSHTHGISASGTHTHTASGGDHTHSVATLPPYYSLAYIMKL
jgi:hypothetical protein